MARKKPRKLTGKQWNESDEFEFVVTKPRGWVDDDWATRFITREEFLQRAIKSSIDAKD